MANTQNSILDLSIANLWGRLYRDEPFFTYAGLAILALCGPTMLLIYTDARTFDGINVWIKPLKFQLSVGLFLLTLAFFARFLPEGMTDRKDYKIYAAVVAFCAVIEIIWICGAAAFAVASHYNTGPIMAAIYGVMGFAAVILTSATLIYGVTMFRSGPISPIMTSIALSLILTFVLTIIVAFRLGANESHFVGVPTMGHNLPLLCWSTEVGDLRVPHFFATHAMHFIPAIAYAVYKIAPACVNYVSVVALNLGYAALTFAAFAQALAGRPFIS